MWFKCTGIQQFNTWLNKPLIYLSFTGVAEATCSKEQLWPFDRVRKHLVKTGPIYTGDGFILQTDHRLGRAAWARNGSSSDNPSVYKYGQADGSSVLTTYPRWFVSKIGVSRYFVCMDDPSACPYTDGLSDELPFNAQARPRRMISLQYKWDHCNDWAVFLSFSTVLLTLASISQQSTNCNRLIIIYCKMPAWMSQSALIGNNFTT